MIANIAAFLTFSVCIMPGSTDIGEYRKFIREKPYVDLGFGSGIEIEAMWIQGCIRGI